MTTHTLVPPKGYKHNSPTVNYGDHRIVLVTYLIQINRLPSLNLNKHICHSACKLCECKELVKCLAPDAANGVSNYDKSLGYGIVPILAAERDRRRKGTPDCDRPDKCCPLFRTEAVRWKKVKDSRDRSSAIVPALKREPGRSQLDQVISMETNAIAAPRRGDPARSKIVMI